MFEQATVRPAYQIAESENAVLRSVFSWMCAGLATTGLISGFIVNTPAAVDYIFTRPLLFWGLIIAEFALVVWLSARVFKMSAGTATSVFLAYSALNGVTLAPIFLVYTSASLTSTFITTAGMFGAMAFYGATTKKDLSGWGSFLMMGLIGIVIAFVVNIFLNSPMVSFVASGIGVVVFTGLTAYDVNQLKRIGAQIQAGENSFRQIAIIGALKLYLDFINLFLMLLRFMGDRR
ncbi:MAG: Bax inhibitor-1/YccA family protein [Bdellovibrionales bacterium]|nr:Bax inhibitor-1/YccA family protein [Bdellovibrionales bacterium]